MITKNNFVFFNADESFSSVHQYYKNLSKQESKNHNALYSVNSVESVIENIKKMEFSYLNESEKTRLLKLLEKEQKGAVQDNSDIYEKKIYLFFAILDFIERSNTPHSFDYIKEDDIKIGSFSGEFANELNDIQEFSGYNPLMFTNSLKKPPVISWENGWKELAQKLGSAFACDIELKEYSAFLKKYEKFRNSILG